MRKLVIKQTSGEVANVIAKAQKHAKQKLRRMVRASRMDLENVKKPAVGLWWFFKNEVYPVGMFWRDAPSSNGLYNINDNHIDAWLQIQREMAKKDPKVNLEEYEDIERGRVFYNPYKALFIITCSTAISKNVKALGKIRDMFGIPLSANLEVQTDSHYEDPLAEDWGDEDEEESLTEWEKDEKRKERELEQNESKLLRKKTKIR